MSETRTLSLVAPEFDPNKLGFFRYGRLPGDKERYILTNDAGEWHLLSKEDFHLFLAGSINAEHPEFEGLQAKCFLREGMDIDGLSDRLAQKKRFLGHGPHLHIVVTTLRCNQSCKYCHASRTSMDDTSSDMSVETAHSLVDLALESNAKHLIFEFQGGEPTLNMDAIRAVVDRARERKPEDKVVEFSLVTNFTQMTEEVAQWLVDNEIQVCTSLDGPADLHNWNRTWKEGDAHAQVLRWMKHLNQLYVDGGKDPRIWHVDALMTTTSKSLDRWKDIVDQYVELGLPNLHLRPLNPYGFAVGAWKKLGYSVEQYLDFYAQALDYIIQLNRDGVEIMEGSAATFLTKILTPEDPNYVDIRSPCGAGTGQVAYTPDGAIFPCDEARMVQAMGDPQFQIGEVGSSSLGEILHHPTVKAMAVASLQDSLPGCDTCWNKPFCGVCPIHNFMNEGNLFGQRPRSPLCKQYLTTATLLMERLANDEDGSVEAIFRRWTITRPHGSFETIVS